MTGDLYTVSLELVNTLVSSPLITTKVAALEVITNMKDIINKTMPGTVV